MGYVRRIPLYDLYNTRHRRKYPSPYLCDGGFCKMK